MQDECKQSKKKGRGGSGSKTNIKNSPVMLRDGDTVGFKVRERLSVS